MPVSNRDSCHFLIGVAELTSEAALEMINLAGASTEKELFPGHPRLFATPRVSPVNTDLLARP